MHCALPVIELKGAIPVGIGMGLVPGLHLSLPTWDQSCRFLFSTFLKARYGLLKKDQASSTLCQLGREADQQKDGKREKIQPPGPVYIRCYPLTFNWNLDRLGYSILSRYQDKARLSRYSSWEFGSRPYNYVFIPSDILRKGLSLDSLLFPVL